MRPTADGYVWTEKQGTCKGVLKCKGVVFPTERRNVDKIYDVIVIGAGYAGLAAARDLTTSSKNSKGGV